VIVAMFVATWVIALAIWRLGRIEERWSARLDRASKARTLAGSLATSETYTIPQHVWAEAEAVRP